MTKRLELLERMIEKGSTDPFVRYARALELRSMGEKERAHAAFAELRERFADYAPTYLMAAQLTIELDRRDDARAWLVQGIEVATRVGDDHAASELRKMLEGL